jgi:hypothetical protein
MGKQVTDTTGAAVTILSLSVPQNADSAVVALLIPGVSGMSLTADSDPAAQVLARRTGSGDAFQDVADSPIDLTPYAGETVSFDFTFHGAAFSGIVKRVALPVRIKYL